MGYPAALLRPGDDANLEDARRREVEQARTREEFRLVVDAVFKDCGEEHGAAFVVRQRRAPKAVEALPHSVCEHLEQALAPRLDPLWAYHDEVRGVVAVETVHARHVGQRVDLVSVLVEDAPNVPVPVLAVCQPLVMGEHVHGITAGLDQGVAHFLERRELRSDGDGAKEGVGQGDVAADDGLAQVEQALGRAARPDSRRHLGVPFANRHEVAVDFARDCGSGEFRDDAGAWESGGFRGRGRDELFWASKGEERVVCVGCGIEL